MIVFKRKDGEIKRSIFSERLWMIMDDRPQLKHMNHSENSGIIKMCQEKHSHSRNTDKQSQLPGLLPTDARSLQNISIHTADTHTAFPYPSK